MFGKLNGISKFLIIQCCRPHQSSLIDMLNCFSATSRADARGLYNFWNQDGGVQTKNEAIRLAID